MQYTQEEKQFIVDSWNKVSIDFLCKKFNRSITSIRAQIKYLRKQGILSKEKRNRDNKSATLEVLLDETHLKYYWLGFLLADGHFSDSGAITLHLGQKDRDHAIKYQHFIKLNEIKEYKFNPKLKYHNSSQMLTMAASNKYVCKLLKERHNISNTKTYNAPNIESFPTEFKKALFIGFIDGDGCIFNTVNTVNKKKYKRTVLCVEIRQEWVNFLKDMVKHLDVTAKIGYTNKETIKISIVSKQKLKEIKQYAIQMNLPIMERKWCNIQ